MPGDRLGLAFALFLAGCASGTHFRPLPEAGLPQELPQDLARKFEVREVGAPPPAPLASPSPSAAPQAQSPPAAGAGQSPDKLAVSAQKRGRRSTKPAQPTEDEYRPAPPAPSPAPLGRSAGAPGVPPNRRTERDPIWTGEKHTFTITYFGTPAGTLDVEVMPFKVMNERKVYHIRANARSSKLFSLFYRIDDTIESFVDYEGFFSHRFHLILDESKQTRDSLELHDSEKGRTFYWNRWNHATRGVSETKEFFPMTPYSQDSVSALFYLRKVPLPDGAVIRFPVISEGKTWEAEVTVMRREPCDTPMGRRQCVVVKPETKFQGVLQKKGDSFLWMTDDDRRFVVRLEAKVRVGTVVAFLKEVVPGNPPQPQ
jgi:hypothetical protein